MSKYRPGDDVGIKKTSNYRLGDLIVLNKMNLGRIITRDHPNSLGAKFYLQKMRTQEKQNIDIITPIVLEHCEKFEQKLPDDIENSIVVHLRLGDVVKGNHKREQLKRPLSVEDLRSKVGDKKDKKYVIGKCHFGENSSKNYTECEVASNIYLNNVIKEVGAKHFVSDDADIDLCCAVKSKLFVQGQGYYSQLIVNIRKKLNRHTITI